MHQQITIKMTTEPKIATRSKTPNQMTASLSKVRHHIDTREISSQPRPRRWLAVVILLLASGHTDALAEPAPISRDAVWREIFARPAPQHPKPNPHRVALGEALFFDSRLSKSGKTSCATCHQPARGFTDGRPTAVGPTGVDLNRNVPTLFNLAEARALLWDGSVTTLENQARGPILAQSEMNATFDAIIAKLSADPEIRARFQLAFRPDGTITEETILQSLADYERSLVSPPTRFDAWVTGDDAALTEDERAGFDIFVGKAGCVACHGGWRFTDDTVHDIGLPKSKASLRTQASSHTKETNGPVRFKTPTLRELMRTAPYMHDGSKKTLADVINHYTGNIERRPSLALQLNRDLALTQQEKRQLRVFLETLSAKNGVTHTEATRPVSKK